MSTESLTRQDLIYLANGARLMRNQALEQVEREKWEANKAASRNAAEVYEELAKKCERMAKVLTRGDPPPDQKGKGQGLRTTIPPRPRP